MKKLCMVVNLELKVQAFKGKKKERFGVFLQIKN